jgi:hypothetical protein
MRGNSREDAALLRQHRSVIKTVNNQFEKIGLRRLHARTKEGIALKVFASLVALAFTNVNWQSRFITGLAASSSASHQHTDSSACG